jgi:hypothetical protein
MILDTIKNICYAFGMGSNISVYEPKPGEKYFFKGGRLYKKTRTWNAESILAMMDEVMEKFPVPAALLILLLPLASCGAKHFKRGYADGFIDGGELMKEKSVASVNTVSSKCKAELLKLQTKTHLLEKEKVQLADECMAHGKLVDSNGLALDCQKVK